MSEPLCPRCQSPLERDMVDVGVGEIPAGPWGCPECHWVEAYVPDFDPDDPEQRHEIEAQFPKGKG